MILNMENCGCVAALFLPNRIRVGVEMSNGMSGDWNPRDCVDGSLLAAILSLFLPGRLVAAGDPVDPASALAGRK